MDAAYILTQMRRRVRQVWTVVKDVPNCWRDAWNWTRGSKGLMGFLKAFRKELIVSWIVADPYYDPTPRGPNQSITPVGWNASADDTTVGR